MNMHDVEKSLLAIIKSFDGQLPREQLEDMSELTRAGEPGIAMENLCTQIFEYDLSVSPTTFETLRCIGTQMGLDPEYWEQLGRQ